MRYRELGKTGLKVSELGFGTIPILAGHVPVLPKYYSPDTDTAIAIMKKAFDMGCNFYDTAIPEEYGDADDEFMYEQLEELEEINESIAYYIAMA